MRVGIVTVSSSRDAANDASGDTLERLCVEAGMEVTVRELVKDDWHKIGGAVASNAQDVDLLLTTGGTGLTLDDITPEATREVLDREVPGIAEAIRAISAQHTPMAMLSRGVAGTIERALIVNLPGSPKACEEIFPPLVPALVHACELLHRGE